MRISPAAFALIVREEVSSQTYYEKHYRAPDWPGGASGCTVGIGYDCGYQDKAKVGRDWTGKIAADAVAALQSVAGVHGAAAELATARIKARVDVPWAAAMAVFLDVDIPVWEAATLKAFPGADKLSGDSLGALTSLCFNRGVGMAGDSRREMAEIRSYCATGEFQRIPDQIRAMKRLWPNSAGLRARRDHEAALFEQGLGKPAAVPVSAPPVSPPPAAATPVAPAPKAVPAPPAAPHERPAKDEDWATFFHNAADAARRLLG